MYEKGNEPTNKIKQLQQLIQDIGEENIGKASPNDSDSKSKNSMDDEESNISPSEPSSEPPSHESMIEKDSKLE